MFDYTQLDLPVKEVIPDVQQHLNNSNTLILKAPTGAGKSTLLPLALLQESWLNGKKIALLEPRRIAAKTIAHRMADLLGEKVGETVGYKIRFENKTSKNTRLEILTEGILTRMLQEDNALEDYACVIFDEFHERSIHADLAMALCRESQNVLREDLRILIMSATIDMMDLSQLLNNAPIVESKGRQFPVEIKYAGDIELRMLPELIANQIQKVVKEEEGDVLVFLPGQGEILKTEALLKHNLKGIHIHPLYGQLSPSQQFAAVMPNKQGGRKIVLATNIAETSLTIEGIKVVIDCGLERRAKYHPKSALSRLETHRISMESADQRTGRAGRLSEGVCYRMWTKATENTMSASRVPEIEEADLSSLVLDLVQWSVLDPEELAWLTPPPKGAVKQAFHLLSEIEAIDSNQITEHGKQIAQLPTHPRLSHMLVNAKDMGQEELALACDLAPFLEEKDPLPQDAGIDINKRIIALRRFRSENRKGGRMAKIEMIASQYRRMFNLEAYNDSYDENDVGVLLAWAYPERIACAKPGNNAQFMMANGKIAMAGHRDDLAHEPWLAVAQVNDRKDGIGKIFLAASLNPKDLAPLVRTKEILKWDYKTGKLVSSIDLRIGSIILKSTPNPNVDASKKNQAICEVLQKEGEHLLDWSKEAEQLINRVESLRKWNPEQSWPVYNKKELLLDCEDWISPYLDGIQSAPDLKKINLKEVLFYRLTVNQQSELDRLAPERVEVPSGSKIKLDYQNDGSVPVLAVRLAECFGLAETPRLNNGSVKVLMHLLSPGYKPVQVTNDLASFWSNAYFDVKKELKARYPKHAWPDDPHSAEAIRGVPKKKK